MRIADAAEAMLRLERTQAAVKGHDELPSKFSKALATLKTLGKVHAIYVRRFDEMLAAAMKEKEQERERGGAK